MMGRHLTSGGSFRGREQKKKQKTAQLIGKAVEKPLKASISRRGVEIEGNKRKKGRKE